MSDVIHVIFVEWQDFTWPCALVLALGLFKQCIMLAIFSYSVCVTRTFCLQSVQSLC